MATLRGGRGLGRGLGRQSGGGRQGAGGGQRRFDGSGGGTGNWGTVNQPPPAPQRKVTKKKK